MAKNSATPASVAVAYATHFLTKAAAQPVLIIESDEQLPRQHALWLA